jgi:spermidine synthase
MLAYGLTIFTSAFLLFQVQPIAGKYILPWFGGGPGVWTTCMLFFQVILFAGYAYAHLSSRWLKPRAQILLQLALVAGALLLLPITPSNAWKPASVEQPVMQILLLLLATLGLPYFVLASTGPLMQQWFSKTNKGVSPYRLYALSNVGSLLALLSYPLFVETHFTRKEQGHWWGAGLLVYAICTGICAAGYWRARPAAISSADKECEALDRQASAPTVSVKALWLLLPACASLLLLAVTNKLCQDVAVIPFLWILPLALYLLSFIICFDSPRWYARVPFALALVAASGGICWVLHIGSDASLFQQVSAYAGALFVCCMVCHGELYRLRPAPRYLTSFYLMTAAGGALGGVFVAVIAPRLFTDFYELQWGLLLCAGLFAVVCARKPVAEGGESELSATERGQILESWVVLACVLPVLIFIGLDWVVRVNVPATGLFGKSGSLILRASVWTVFVFLMGSWILRGGHRNFRFWRQLTVCWLMLGTLALGVVLWGQTREVNKAVISTTRNFYGVLRVYDYPSADEGEHYKLLEHGQITHGIQFADASQSSMATTYYGEESGVGLAMHALASSTNRQIGLVGLGAGTLTVYGKPGDHFRIYEINPEVKHLATSAFSYVSKSAAKVEIVMGDARLSMEREPAQNFDLLALDAFSSDAIPVHLLTKEAFEIYERHLKPNGILAVHVSNHYLDLEPVVLRLANEFNFTPVIIDFEEEDERWWLYASTWILLTRDKEMLNAPAISQAARVVKVRADKVRLWTDDFTGLFQILK